MTPTTRVLAVAVLSLVVLAAQVPSDPPTPTPSEVSDEKQGSSGNQSPNTNEVEPLEGIGTGPVSTTDEPETQIRTGEGSKQTDKENHSSAENEFNAWLSLLLSFVIVCFTGVSAYVAWKQFRIAREAH